jgi:immune inhibitor A
MSVNRRTYGVIGGAATITLLATAALQGSAVAAPPANPGASNRPSAAHKADDRPNTLENKRRELNKRAVQQVINGERQVQGRGGSQAVRVAPGQWAEYGLQDSGEILSFLVDFGDQVDERTGTDIDDDPEAVDIFPTADAGPMHNQIPEPGADDNTTYWTDNFDRQHYLDMFFNGMSEQNNESFKGVYEEMSSGRYTVNGDVSDWVTIPYNEASYGYTESNTDMTRFIDDSAEAWLKAQENAGKGPDEIAAYLAKFDVWDRYDYNGNGNFDEPDGYIDHFQAIHAGEGEEAGAPDTAIWSHRWAANQGGDDGPGEAKFGGVEIGNTGYWIRDYTTEPENGGLGVFAHEFGHDLGLPDFYDTQGGENGTAFWTLMSSGSWLNHGGDAIGTTPNHMGPWEKFQLGWLDYDVARAGTTSTHKLGPSYHGTKKSQALITILPKKKVTETVGTAAEGTDFFYSGTGDARTATLTSPSFTVPAGGSLAAKVNYSIEKDWDYAYAEISIAGGEFAPLPTNLSTDTNENDANDGHGITGSSDNKWVDLTADLTQHAGEQAKIRFRMVNDAAVHGKGLLVDQVTVGNALAEGAENGAAGWTMDKFVIAENGQTVNEYNNYYIAENRQYAGYDKTLAQGPYNFGFAGTAPNKVERFPYQNGLLVWYWNTQYTNNNVSQHPGGGEVLPVDARAAAQRWSDGAVARNRIQSYDATFGLERTDPLSLHRDVMLGDQTGFVSTTLQVPSQKAAPVFDDTDPMAYYDAENPAGSVKVAGTGTTIRVVDQNKNGMMQLKVN